MLRLHYHSECDFFAGCENMIANFIQSDLSDDFDITFSHPNSEIYVKGLSERVKSPSAKLMPIYLPKLPRFLFLNRVLPQKISIFIGLYLRVLFGLTIFIYDLVYLFFILLRVRPHILHINNGGYPGAISARAAALVGRILAVPVVIMVVNNIAVDYQRSSRKLEYPIDRLVTGSVDAFVASSKIAVKKIGQVLNVPQHRLFKIHNGVSRDIFEIDPASERKNFSVLNSKIIVFGVVAVLEKRKGHHVLLEALQTLIKSGINTDYLRVLIEGDGGLKSMLMEKSVEKGLTPVVDFVGQQKDVTKFMQTCDVIILPSIKNEDFPNVVIEAMALAKPVIATKVAGTVEQIYHNKTGLLVSPNNALELAEALQFFITNPEIAHPFGKAGQEIYLERFTAEKSVERYRALYRKLLKDER